MKLYTLREASKLAEFYKDKLIGKRINPSLNSNIERFDFVEFKIGKYKLNCVGTVMGSIIPCLEISNVLDNFDYPKPEEVLDV